MIVRQPPRFQGEPTKLDRLSRTAGGNTEITRRDLFAGALLPFVHLAQQTQTPNNTVFQHDLPNIAMDDWQVTANTINLAPGAGGNPHRHPDFVLVYVLEGEAVTKVSGQPVSLSDCQKTLSHIKRSCSEGSQS